MRKEEFCEILGDINPKYVVEASEYRKTKVPWYRKWSAVAACFILFISLSVGSVAMVVEAKEYKAAVRFFDEYNMSLGGLTRDEIKAVYRDITTQSFTYSKTAEVIRNSLISNQIGGYEIMQNSITPEDVENMWNCLNFDNGVVDFVRTGVEYHFRSEYKEDPKLGFDVHDKSYIEKYDGESLIWSVSVSEFSISGYSTVSDGVIAYGETPTWSSKQIKHSWMVKIDTDGNIIWKHMLDNGFEDEYIGAILENDDGSVAVFSRGDFEYFCLSQYTSDGKEIKFAKTDVGNYGIWNVARLGDGYIVQLGNYITNEHSRIVKVDRDGNITDSFSYGDNESYYYITDMIGFGGNIYLSAYAVPMLEDDDPNYGSRYEIAGILNYIFDNGLLDISSEKLTPMVQELYTAILLVCDPNSGETKEFYSVKGSMGGKLSIGDNGELLWDVQNIFTTFFSPMTSSFTIGGTSYVFRYTFDDTGSLVGKEKTGELAIYRR